MINDFSTLQQAIADELARSDLTSAIPTFIQLAEADFNRQLRTRQMQTLVIGTAVGQTITLPADLRAVQSLYVTYANQGVEIHPLDPTALADRPVNQSGVPQGYVVVGDTAYLIGGQGDLAYTLTYFQALTSVSAGQNWLILREPGLYLYQSLAHSAPYLKNDQRLLTWAQLTKAIREGMEAEDDMSRYGNAPAMRSPFHCAP